MNTLKNLWDDMITVRVRLNGRVYYRKARRDINDKVYIILLKNEYFISA
jgi:hypothetical protein